jgi:hypothetical protein
MTGKQKGAAGAGGKGGGHFDADDVDLLESALELVPDLDIVTYIAKLARKRAQYPLSDHAALRTLFGRSRSGRFKDRVLTVEHAERFLPREFFPIDSERDLMCKLLIVFQRGRLFHLQEESTGSAVPLSGQEGTLLPSPVPGVPGKPATFTRG